MLYPIELGVRERKILFNKALCQARSDEWHFPELFKVLIFAPKVQPGVHSQCADGEKAALNILVGKTWYTML